MSLFTEEARARCIAQACRGLDHINPRPIRGLGLPLRSRGEAIADIREYEATHGLPARDVQPLNRPYVRAK